jgi:hypothetical protein
MPKVKVSPNTKLQLYQREFEGEMITTDNKILHCRACGKRFQVLQYMNTNLHKENIKIKFTKVLPFKDCLANFLVLVFHISPVTCSMSF